ncbi:MMPL family transporter [Umezawaea endophytica]|uniref:Efflux RND transporter permease subunit n=1 Tax=Umezawaea endophytica TaxID=1654476 RepID=A0A9X3AJ18_9PSEU|nr:efflux RND transporter permease subunit [Umezawaea endophytica]MCS7483346.1 efflux RND transporter permease subunit [Umezawaea endophytica]
MKWLRWTLPALLVAVWLLVGGIGGPLQGKLSEVQKNDNASFLPASAEATEVADWQKRFADQESLPALVVFERDGGLTEEDLRATVGRGAALATFDGLAGDVVGPVPSEDGEAAQIIVPLKPVGSEITDVVEDLRALVREGLPSGLTVHVTGPAGILGDFANAFGGIDGLLLLVTAVVVALILLVVYRSPLLPLVVILNAGLALCLAVIAVYLLAREDVLTLNGQSQGILFILVFGASTDYSLLLVARFREELHRHEDRWSSLRTAMKRSLEPIVASAGTVIIGLLCLLLSDLKSNQGLGPVAAIGIAASLVATLTFLPAMLALIGRSAFWPFRPKFDTVAHKETGLWQRVSAFVGRRARATWIVTTLVLLVGVAFVPQLKANGVAQTDFFLNPVESVTGQEVLTEHFDGGTGSPAVIVVDQSAAQEAVTKAKAVPGVAEVAPSSDKVVDGKVELLATLKAPADSAEATTALRQLRTDLRPVGGAIVGGVTAIQVDVQDTAKRDLRVIIPVVLLVIFLILALLLRALLAPLLLIATVVLSFAATLGVAALVFDHVLGFPGADPSVPLFAFVFLVALGIDYNIFLMTRVREESIRHGTREGTLIGLSVTGGVITSAGVVLAATFAALAVLPILFLAQIAFLVAFGVLLDTLIVRSLLVPALTVDIGRAVWWPSALARRGVTGVPADEKSSQSAHSG